MAVNLHDSAYDLEKAIRKSEEYKNLKEAYEAVNSDPASRQLFDQFREVQMNLQQKQMMGEDISEEEVENAQKSVALIQQDAKIVRLLESEQNMSMAINELNKIIMKPLEELYGAVSEY